MANQHRTKPCPGGCGKEIRLTSNQCQNCNLASRRGHVTTAPASTSAETLSVEGNRAELTKIVPGRVKTLADLIRVCEIDTDEWEVERYLCNKWDVGMKKPAVAAVPNAWTRSSDKPVIVELYQVKVWLRRKVALVFVRSEIDQLKRDAKKVMPIIKALPRVVPKGGNLLQISIPDVHMGKLAWKPETGANYDLKIAERGFETALGKLLERTAGWSFSKVVFIIGNDLLHTDNPNGTTARGTPQDTEGRFQKTFWKTRQMITRSIERLRLIAPVDVLPVPGNHDTQTLWHLGDSLECWYRDCSDVTIDNAPQQRKYYEFGKVMLMFTHGDKGKKQDYPLLMATEKPEMFGRTLYRECHTGHLHQLQVREQHGVRVRVSPALCAADAWHAENQYVGNQRAAEAFVWSPVEGLISQVTWTVPEGD